MRMVSWLLGIALGLIAGGAVLEAGVLVLLPLVLAVVWAAREKARPLGLGGLFIGLGAGSAGLLAFALLVLLGRGSAGSPGAAVEPTEGL